METDGVAGFLKGVPVNPQAFVDALVPRRFVPSLGEELRETQPRRQALASRYLFESPVVQEKRLQLVEELVPRARCRHAMAA